MLSLHIEKAINWLKKHTDGGIVVHPGGPPYPEVTGYTIPTLLKYGEYSYARELTDWLLSVQNEEGSFDGLNSIVGPSIFDTVAAYEGLSAMGEEKAADMAYVWARNNLQRMFEKEDYLVPVYHARSAKILNLPTDYWDDKDWWSILRRTHYLAYHFEGTGADVPVRNVYFTHYMKDWEVHITSTNPAIGASWQMACLTKTFDEGLLCYHGDDGSIPLTKHGETWSWPIKFFLDAVYEPGKF